MGLPTENFTYDMLPTLRAQATTESERYNRALTERKMAMEQAKMQQGEVKSIGDNLVRVTPDGQATEIYHGQPKPGTFADKISWGKDQEGNPIALVQTPNGLQRVDPNGLPSLGSPSGQSQQSQSAMMSPAMRNALARQAASQLKSLEDASLTSQGNQSTLDELNALRQKTNLEGKLYGDGAINTMVTRTIGRNIGSPFGGYIIPSSDQVAALDAMESPATKMQLDISKETKGAISDREMAAFARATPGSQMTDEAASNVISAYKAVNQRKQEHAAFYEQWIATHGNGLGAEQAWQRFTDANPIISTDQKGNVKVDPKKIGGWDAYLSGGGTMGGRIAPINTGQNQLPQPRGNSVDPLGILGN
jgi:hypothetical protein